MESNSVSITAELIRRLFVCFPQGTHVELADQYVQALAGHDPMDLAKAISRIIEVREKKFPPSIAEVKTRAQEARMERVRATHRWQPQKPEERTEEELSLIRAVAAFRKQFGFGQQELLLEKLSEQGFDENIIRRFVG